MADSRLDYIVIKRTGPNGTVLPEDIRIQRELLVTSPITGEQMAAGVFWSKHDPVKEAQVATLLNQLYAGETNEVAAVTAVKADHEAKKAPK